MPRLDRGQVQTYSDSEDDNDGDGNLRETGITVNQTLLRRFAKWFWSGWTATDTTTSTNDNDDNKNGITAHADYETFPCRTCRMRKVECDRILPHCSHCLHEQLLCFYVEPLRITRKRAKELQSSSL